MQYTKFLERKIKINAFTARYLHCLYIKRNFNKLFETGTNQSRCVSEVLTGFRFHYFWEKHVS